MLLIAPSPSPLRQAPVALFFQQIRENLARVSVPFENGERQGVTVVRVHL